MKIWMCAAVHILVIFAVGVLASTVRAADDPRLLIPPGVAPNPTSDRPQGPPASGAADERQRILQEKTAELHKLQDEVLKLGGTIANPRKVRITVRAVEIYMEDLQEHNLTDPFQPEVDIWHSKAEIINFESDKMLLRALELVVTSGCAEVLLSPTVVTSMGETVVVNCFREFPLTDESEVVNKQRDLHSRSERVPGHAVLARAADTPEGDLQVTFGYRITVEEPAPPGSQMMTSTIRVKSGAPLVFGGFSNSPRSPKRINQQLTAVPSALKPENLAQTRFYTIVTAERLIDD